MRFLIADSNLLFNRLVKLKLEKWGHTVDIAMTGDEAMKALDRSSYRMVIMDWGLEGFDAPALCNRIRNLASVRYTYILFYSERDDHDSMVAAYKAGADDYLIKPFNPLLLQLRISTGKRMLNLEDELRELASYDQTTGLISYATFKDFFTTFLSGAIRHDLSGAVLFLHLANYSNVEQEHGSIAATKLMIEIANLLAKAVRTSDLVAKVDDDHFCILLPQTPEANIGHVLQNIQGGLANATVTAGATRIEPFINAEVAGYPVEGMSAEEVLAPANRKTVGSLSVDQASVRAG
jgi:diguanylate cyclase (GGDEF)-like protein